MNQTERHLIFSGDNLPQWQPHFEIALDYSKAKITKQYLHFKDTPAKQVIPFYVVDHFMESDQCRCLMVEFQKVVVQPVGVNGYGTVIDNDVIGSYRSNAWCLTLAKVFAEGMRRVLVDDMDFKAIGKGELFKNTKGEQIAIPLLPNHYQYLGPTPYMRFMKYYSGGRHAPHYDALFHNDPQRFVTLMSWVLYLNTPYGSGGAFQFVEDGQGALVPSLRNRTDWRRMANSGEILASIFPVSGRLLIFPHWLPHQVQLYQSDSDQLLGTRSIIRGDIAFGYD